MTPRQGVEAAAWPSRVVSPAEVSRVLSAVTDAAGRRAGTAELRRPVGQAGELHTSQRRHELLPTHPLLVPLFPGGALRRGSTVAVAGATSLIIGLLIAHTGVGGYAALVGMPAFGALAAAESGVDLERLALIPDPGPDWPAVIAALLDGIDLVVVSGRGRVSADVAGRLGARARRVGAALIPVGPAGAWPGADLQLTAELPRWEGLGQGRGRIRHGTMTVSAIGRGAAARRREITVPAPLPDPADMPTPRQLRPAGPGQIDPAAQTA